MPSVQRILTAIAFVFLLLGPSAQAAIGRVDGTLSGGYADLNAVSPSADFKVNPGSAISVEAEKPFGTSPIYLVGGVTYLRATGSLNYHYLSPTSITYIQNGVNYTLDEFHVNLGLRFKLFDSGNWRPYVGAGGTGGFFQVTYDNTLKTPAVTDLGGDYATVDSTMNFGLYGEVGLEIQLLETMGVRLAYMYMDAYTSQLATLNNQNIHYYNAEYYGGVFLHF